jgi:hypothetical protein
VLTVVSDSIDRDGPAWPVAYKLIEVAQFRWRAVNAAHLVALVRAGATRENGKLEVAA